MAAVAEAGWVVLRQAAWLTLEQLVSLFGAFMVLGFFVHQVEKRTTALWLDRLGWRGVLWTAWLGAPVHELSHVAACVAFRHKLEVVRLYDPDPVTGTLGYVLHSYRRRSLYQRIGNFFIGVAPLVGGAATLAAAAWLLLPNHAAVFEPARAAAAGFQAGGTFAAKAALFVEASWGTLRALFTWANAGTWTFWVFLYVSLCVVSHMAPSAADLDDAGVGFALFAAVLLAANAGALMARADPAAAVRAATAWATYPVALVAFAAIGATANYAVSFALTRAIPRRR